jgi:hypothetical protein
LAERHDAVEQVAEKVAGLEALVREARAVTERVKRQPSDRLERKVKSLDARKPRTETDTEAVA